MNAADVASAVMRWQHPCRLLGVRVVRNGGAVSGKRNPAAPQRVARRSIDERPGVRSVEAPDNHGLQQLWIEVA